MKKFIYSFIIIFSFLWSCKKDSAVSIGGSLPQPEPTEPSARYKLLTQNYWRLAYYWKDTSQPAKDHPDLVPLSTSYNNTYYADSCEYYTGERFSSEDGKVYLAKGIHCGYTTNAPYYYSYYGTLPASSTIPWHLGEDESKIYYANYFYNILQLDSTTFSYYEYQTYNFTKTLVAVKIYKSYKDW